MSIASFAVTAGPTPQVINPNFKKPMTRCTLIGVNGNGQTTVEVQGQTFFVSAGLGIRFEQPGPITITGNGDGLFVVAEQSDNYQLTGKLWELLVYSTSGGGGGNTYSADGITLSLSGNTFSVKNGGIDTTQLANNAVDATKLNSSVAGAGLSGGGGSALAVNVDNSTIEVSFTDNLQVKASGIGAFQLATGAVETDKILSKAVNATKMGGGSLVDLQWGRCSYIDALANLSPGDYIEISADNAVALPLTVGYTAGTDFAIGATAADTLANLAAVVGTSLPTHVKMTLDSTGTYALLTPLYPGYPAVFPNNTSTLYVLITSNLTGGAWGAGATPDVVAGVSPGFSIARTALYPIVVQPTADDVARGFLAFRPDPSSVWQNTYPFLLAQNAGVMKPIGCSIAYDALLDAWLITNTGTNDYAAGDKLMVLAAVPGTL